MKKETIKVTEKQLKKVKGIEKNTSKMQYQITCFRFNFKSFFIYFTLNRHLFIEELVKIHPWKYEKAKGIWFSFFWFHLSFMIDRDHYNAIKYSDWKE